MQECRVKRSTGEGFGLGVASSKMFSLKILYTVSARSIRVVEGLYATHLGATHLSWASTSSLLGHVPDDSPCLVWSSPKLTGRFTYPSGSPGISKDCMTFVYVSDTIAFLQTPAGRVCRDPVFGTSPS